MGECGRLEDGTVCGRARRDPEVRRSGRGGIGATNGTAGLCGVMTTPMRSVLDALLPANSTSDATLGDGGSTST